MIWTVLQVGLGGAIGATGRYLTGVAAVRVFGTHFPFGTLSANIIGSFLMGIAYVYLMTRNEEVSRLVPFIMTGMLGGYTTFSAFTLDVWGLFDNDRFIAAGLYLGASLGIAILALILGISLAKGYWG